MRNDAAKNTRRENFEAYYRSNPDKLKGKTVDEAYSAMRRQVARNLRGGANSGDKGFVGPVAGVNQTQKPKQDSDGLRLGMGGPTIKIHLPTISKKDQQDTLNGVHNAIARRLNKFKKF